MTILVRADAGAVLGSGHVVRCANLVRRVRSAGEPVVFAMGEATPLLVEWLHEQGFMVARVPPPSDAADDEAFCLSLIAPGDHVIVDHYGLDAVWESVMRGSGANVVVIDALANRPHDRDVFIDPSPVEDSRMRDARLVPADARLFLGPSFALIREDFFQPGLTRDRDGSIERILVFLGRGVTSREVVTVLHALDMLVDGRPEVVVLLGNAFPDSGPVRDFAAGRDWLSVVGVTDDVPALMRWADLAIGSCGGASWERCALGLPTVAVVTADNQANNAEGLVRAGDARYLGMVADVTEDGWARAVQDLLWGPAHMRGISSAARVLTAGNAGGLADLTDALRRRARP